MSSSEAPGTPIAGLLAVTAAAVCVQGYHLGADDAAIYVPGIKKVADPALYPFGAEFIQSHARLTLFPNLVGGTARFMRLPADWAIFAWHIAGVFLLLLAGWKLVCACFANAPARWGGVALLAALLGVPVAGTALAIADPYVTSRTLSTPAGLLAVAAFLAGRRKQAAGWWLLTAVIHPQMSVYVAVFLGCAEAARRWSHSEAKLPAAHLAYYSVLPFLFPFEPARGPAREALYSRTYFFASQWAWYEWVGAIAPLVLLWWFGAGNFRGTKPAFRAAARSLVPFGLLSMAAFLMLAIPERLENYARLQPMRAFQLIYVLFFLLLGGLIGEYVLERRAWRWAALFLVLAVSLSAVQLSAYPASAHLEWPLARPANPWIQAFLWIRHNSPKDAVFALDPQYMARPGEDMHGFRAVAERSMLADAVKDSGVVSLFPQLAGDWKSQVEARTGWRHFKLSDFQRLSRQYPVTWVVAEQPAAGLVCPYRNRVVAVCRIPDAGR
ncbi:MAG TPA: hypothetical protein VJ732_12225 [Bryobacteraceae bacterium]|nr:hypothetical protein [Bryobacteraceae bacterium]